MSLLFLLIKFVFESKSDTSNFISIPSDFRMFHEFSSFRFRPLFLSIRISKVRKTQQCLHSSESYSLPKQENNLMRKHSSEAMDGIGINEITTFCIISKKHFYQLSSGIKYFLWLSSEQTAK